jgi:hypothetical protein
MSETRSLAAEVGLFKPPVPERVDFVGPAGLVEALIEVPAGFNGRRAAVLCHPHPLFGGTMRNKVIHMTARALQESGMATLRFNFRGVERSEGVFDEGRGETDDAMAACDYAQRLWPQATLSLAGFSFGAYVAYQVAARRSIDRLVMIAPPVQRFDFAVSPPPSVPWTVIQGDQDELVDHQQVLLWAQELRPAPIVRLIHGAEHFFHGRLQELKDAIRADESL